MSDIDTDRFLVLFGECPGEGVWCWAKTYTELVKCVQDAWGYDFTPVFKYELPCILTDANAHTRREGFSEAEDAQGGAAMSEAEGTGPLAPVPAKTRPSTCLVVLNDADDFQLWRYGGAYMSATGASGTPGAFVHHHGSPEGSAEGIMHAVSHHMDYYRPASGAQYTGTCNSATRTPTAVTAHVEGEQERVWEPRRLTSTLYAFSSCAHTMNSHSAQPRQIGSSRLSSDGAHRRASPPVRRADADVIQAPLQCILDPALILRLGVTVVLRHSAAPAEVVLFSGNTPTGQGELPWGALCLKARHAWGVHSPQFRYVDFSRGVTQMLINHVNDYRAWSRLAQLDNNRELLVVEQAPSATKGASFASPESRTAVCRYYEEEWPMGRYGSSKSVAELVSELKALEREERMAAVARFGRETKTPISGDLTVVTGGAKPVQVTDALSEPLPIDAALVPLSEKATVAPPGTSDSPPPPTEYCPLLLQKSLKHSLMTPAPLNGQSRPSLSSTATTTATTPLCAPATTDEKIDAEIRGSFLDAEHYARLMGLLSAERPDPAVASGSGGRGVISPSEAAIKQSPGGAEGHRGRSRPRMLDAQKNPAPMGTGPRADAETASSQSPCTHLITPANFGGDTSATTAHESVPLCTPLTSACKSDVWQGATLVPNSNVVSVENAALVGHERARLHNAFLSNHFRTHSPNPASARGIGATPVW
ncbi:hypothetical protein JKF63_05236 [Porcisia hertigi]|uniref:Uncharacterized protein n=1 Tax=Porcisia hertigi TaxID=2761500 RepID=A0A836IYV9_9TRYP|nr:hypothetical protein JKF63_05236 [Porcisia hertigi]